MSPEAARFHPDTDIFREFGQQYAEHRYKVVLIALGSLLLTCRP